MVIIDLIMLQNILIFQKELIIQFFDHRVISKQNMKRIIIST